MIYIKDGKLLVAADGKLCSSCCYEYADDDCNACEPSPFPDGATPKYFDVTFSGITLCPTASWPGGVNLNTTWQLTQTSACIWEYTDANWHIILRLNVGGSASALGAYDASDVPTYYTSGSLAHCLHNGTNIVNTATCTPFTVWGTSGTASWVIG